MGDFVDGDSFHATEVDWALAKKTGTAFHVMPQNNMSVAEWPSEKRFGRAENGDHWYAQQRSQMHGARVVRQQQTALTQFFDKLIEGCLTDAVQAMNADCRRDLLAYCCLVFCPKQNPLRR